MEVISNNRDHTFYNIVVYGQQRITTFFLLTKALLDVAIEKESQKDIEELKSYLYLSKNKEKKIELNINDDKEFSNLLRNSSIVQSEVKTKGKSKGKSKTQSNIFDNYLFFKNELLKKIEEENITIQEIIDLFSMTEYVSIEIDNDEFNKDFEDCQIIFERINSTGVELTVGDLIKNFLLMCRLDQEKLYEDNWLEMEKKFSKDTLKNYIYHYVIYKAEDHVDQSRKSYDFFKSKFEENNWHKDAILKEMLELSDIYLTICQEKEGENDTVNKLLTDIKFTDQKNLLSFFNACFKRL